MEEGGGGGVDKDKATTRTKTNRKEVEDIAWKITTEVEEPDN